jgi:hypothetical protein
MILDGRRNSPSFAEYEKWAKDYPVETRRSTPDGKADAAFELLDNAMPRNKTPPAYLREPHRAAADPRWHVLQQRLALPVQLAAISSDQGAEVTDAIVFGP